MSYKRFKFIYKETIATILAENEEFYEIAVKAVLEARSEIERYAMRNPLFLISYEPIECDAGGVVRRMCDAAKLAKVGPMAAVAGAIADFAVEKMIENGAKFAVVDNGGDISIFTDRELRVGIYPTNFAFVVSPGKKLGICTSSGKIGPSVSFGFADCATVIAENACVADAFATALGNRVKEDCDIEKVVQEFYEEFYDHIFGVLVVKDETIAFAGEIPRIEESKVDPDLITKL
ncbi:MAG: UPF0280 family protein [Archaeoglobaceae archaeon]